MLGRCRQGKPAAGRRTTGTFERDRHGAGREPDAAGRVTAIRNRGIRRRWHFGLPGHARSSAQRNSGRKHTPSPHESKVGKGSSGAANSSSAGTQALVIQIVPHHNGEVFLSKGAANQNPAFFGWPFTGQTIPKKPENPSYPQRTPDPVVDLKVYDPSGKLVIRHATFNLNTVYYEKKSEIRITVPPDVVKAVPAGSVMVMRQAAEQQNLDYDVDIYVKGSPQYNEYLGVCNQTMPSGGKAKARRFGWL